MYLAIAIISSVATVQLASKFTLKRERSHEPRRIFKSTCKLLASAHTSLTELLLTSYVHVHDYCTSAKYSRVFVHVRMYVTRTSALTSSANTCHSTYVCIRARIRLYRFKLSSGMLVKSLIYPKNFTKITK